MLQPSRHQTRQGIMGAQSVGMEQTNDANRRLVRFYGVCLGSLVFVYALLGIRLFAAGEAFGLIGWSVLPLRAVLGAAALLVIFYPAWLSRALDRQVDQMGTLFEDQFATTATSEKIRL